MIEMIVGFIIGFIFGTVACARYVKRMFIKK